MVPLKIQIKNFLSYGPELQEINFEPYNLICLSGKNGHGKSALLDAITWALWGQARKNANNSKPDEGLLRIGQRNMLVVFDFVFSGQKYRIRREFTFAYAKSYSYLDFGVLDNDENIISLTGKTIRETQEKINSTLGLDYDAFVNSAFLRQGNSNEFSKKSPKERKEILSSILGLDKYESLKKDALERARELANQKDTLIKMQERIEIDLKEKDDTENLRKDIEEKISSIKINLENLAKLTSEKELAIKNVSDKKNESKIVQFQLNEIESKIESLIEEGKESYKEWKIILSKILNLKDADKIRQRYDESEKEIIDLENKIKICMELKEQLIALKEREFNIRNNITNEYQKNINAKKFEAESYNIKYESLKNEIEKIDNLIQKTTAEALNLKLFIDANKIKDISKKEILFEKRKEFYHYIVNSGNFAKTQLQELIKKRELTLDEENPSCPLCMQNLSTARKKFLKQQMEKSELSFKYRISRAKEILITVKEILINLDNDIKSAKESNLKIEKATNELNSFEKDLIAHKEIKAKTENDLKANLAKKNNLDKEIKELESENLNALATNKEYLSISKLLKEIPEQLDLFKYIPDELNKKRLIKKELYELLEFIKDISQHKERKAEKENLIISNNKKIKSLKCELLTINKTLEALKTEIIKEDNLNKELLELKSEIVNNNSQLGELLLTKGTIEAKLEKIKSLEAESSQNQKTISSLEKEITDYKDIANAYGKDGIQALLIEESIPEIEDEANHILARLTDNKSQIFIESLRDLKKGGTKETLDIKVSDEIGIRDYEMFSGGEAFRVDFALRIAISKLLAQRSGASLQTLIIDEGFGSQDEEGLSNIMEAIYKIQTEFEKVIIVSHLTSMKDQFPVHFVIKKGPAGTSIEIQEQG